jgi:hypothetical protein
VVVEVARTIETAESRQRDVQPPFELRKRNSISASEHKVL